MSDDPITIHYRGNIYTVDAPRGKMLLLALLWHCLGPAESIEQGKLALFWSGVSRVKWEWGAFGSAGDPAADPSS